MDDYSFTYTLKVPTKPNPWIVVKANDAEALKRKIASVFAGPDDSVDDMITGQSLMDIVLMVDEQMAGGSPAPKPVDMSKDDTPKAKGEVEDMPVVESDEALLEKIKSAPSEDALTALWENTKSKWTQAHISAAGKRSAELKGDN